MRIIAGQARSRTLFAPKGRDTRPTLDFVRESLFNIIQRYVPDASVLDLFAGSGALALEALSRGAKQAVLADQSRRAIECIRRNVNTLGFAEDADILQGSWGGVLERLTQAGRRFDLVFLDPPYSLTQYPEIMETLSRHKLLQSGALIIIEHQKDVCFNLPQNFVPKDCRTYGDTAITMAAFDIGGETDG
jgi:16S rRNA (guanine966-N2)-methyltransferase